MVDRAVIVLLFGVGLQLFISYRPEPDVWRDDLRAELSLAIATLEQTASPTAAELVHGHGGTTRGNELLSAAIGNLRRRVDSVAQQLVDYDELFWAHKLWYNGSTFSGHTAWFRSWRSEWQRHVDVVFSNRATVKKSQLGVASENHDSGDEAARSSGDGAGEADVLQVSKSARHGEPQELKSVISQRVTKRDAPGKVPVTPVDGIMDEVLASMHAAPANADVQERGCEALRYLATDADTQAGIIARHGIRTVVGAMKGHTHLAGVQGHCCGTLAHLVATPYGQQVVVAQNGLAVILRAMVWHRAVGLVQYKACAALANFASGAQNQVEVARRGGVKAVLKALEAHLGDPSVAEHCSGALHNLAVSADNRANITIFGGVRTLRSILKVHTNAAEVQRVCRTTLELLGAE